MAPNSSTERRKSRSRAEDQRDDHEARELRRDDVMMFALGALAATIGYTVSYFGVMA